MIFSVKDMNIIRQKKKKSDKYTSICLPSLLITEYSAPDSWYNVSVKT